MGLFITKKNYDNSFIPIEYENFVRIIYFAQLFLLGTAKFNLIGRRMD